MCGRAAVPRNSASISERKSSFSSAVPSHLELQPGRMIRSPGTWTGVVDGDLLPVAVHEVGRLPASDGGVFVGHGRQELERATAAGVGTPSAPRSFSRLPTWRSWLSADAGAPLIHLPSGLGRRPTGFLAATTRAVVLGDRATRSPCRRWPSLTKTQPALDLLLLQHLPAGLSDLRSARRLLAAASCGVLVERHLAALVGLWWMKPRSSTATDQDGREDDQQARP